MQARICGEYSIKMKTNIQSIDSETRLTQNFCDPKATCHWHAYQGGTWDKQYIWRLIHEYVSRTLRNKNITRITNTQTHMHTPHFCSSYSRHAHGRHTRRCPAAPGPKLHCQVRWHQRAPAQPHAGEPVPKENGKKGYGVYEEKIVCGVCKRSQASACAWTKGEERAVTQNCVSLRYVHVRAHTNTQPDILLRWADVTWWRERKSRYNGGYWDTMCMGACTRAYIRVCVYVCIYIYTYTQAFTGNYEHTHCCSHHARETLHAYICEWFCTWRDFWTWQSSVTYLCWWSSPSKKDLWWMCLSSGL